MVRQSRPEVTTALIAAAANGQTEIVQLLLAASADVTLITQPEAATALSRAATRGHLEAVRLLLGAKPGQTAQSGNLALVGAATNGHENVVRTLLDAGIAANPASSSDNSAVYMAACGGHTGALRALLDKGGNSNARRPSGDDSALGCALSQRKFAAAGLLVERGADISNSWNRTPFLHSAIGYSSIDGRLEMIALLLDNGANVDALDPNGQTPLGIAIQAAHSGVRGSDQDREQTAVVNLLLARGANVNLKSAGTAPLYLAAQKGLTDIVQALLAKGADVNAAAVMGESVLKAAARYPEVIEILRNAGAK